MLFFCRKFIHILKNLNDKMDIKDFTEYLNGV